MASKGFEAATRASLVVRDSLQRSGLVTNVQKSIVQSLTWLGFDLDLSQGLVSVPKFKIENLKGQLRSLQNQCSCQLSRLPVWWVR